MTNGKPLSPARTGVALVLAIGLATTCVPSVMAKADDNATEQSQASGAEKAHENQAAYRKAEVVYANLSAQGNPESVYVVNRFDVDTAGEVLDRGDYQWVRNLSTEDSIERVGDAYVFPVEEGTFYYQGAANATELPWLVSATYTLDGREVYPDELAGKSGHLAVSLTTKQNPAVDQAFYESYMLQITFTLADKAARNITAPNATLASSGSNRTVAFTALPGKDADFTFEADVTDFEMTGAQIAALPYTSVVEVPETDSMVDGMSELADAVSALNDASGEMSTGVDELARGALTLEDGAADVGAGLDGLAAGGQTLKESSAQISDALSQQAFALSQAAAGLTASLDPQDPAQAALLEKLAPITQIAEGLSTTAEQYGSFDAGLVQYVDGVSSAAAGYDQIQTGIEGVSAGLASLAGGSAQLAQGTSALNSETAALPDTMRRKIQEMMADFEFPEFTHVSFASPENSPIEEVQFVMTLGDIAIPKEEPVQVKEPEPSFWDRLKALFVPDGDTGNDEAAGAQ